MNPFVDDEVLRVKWIQRNVGDNFRFKVSIPCLGDFFFFLAVSDIRCIDVSFTPPSQTLIACSGFQGKDSSLEQCN